MKLRHKYKYFLAQSSEFNLSCLGEILITYLPDGDRDSDYIKNYEVYLERNKAEWKDMIQAFKDHDLITNVHNTVFFEPSTREDRERGLTLS